MHDVNALFPGTESRPDGPLTDEQSEQLGGLLGASSPEDWSIDHSYDSDDDVLPSTQAWAVYKSAREAMVVAQQIRSWAASIGVEVQVSTEKQKEDPDEIEWLQPPKGPREVTHGEAEVMSVIDGLLRDIEQEMDDDEAPAPYDDDRGPLPPRPLPAPPKLRLVKKNKRTSKKRTSRR